MKKFVSAVLIVTGLLNCAVDVPSVGNRYAYAQESDAIAVTASAPSVSASQDPPGSDEDGFVETLSYNDYLLLFPGETFSPEEIVIDDADMTGHSPDTAVYGDYQGERAVYTSDSGYVEFAFQVKTAGFYNIGMEYCAVPETNMEIIRSFEIDGRIPFNELREIGFSRCWMNSGIITQDKNGNDMRPEAEELSVWMQKTLQDDMGFFTEPLKIFLSKGDHILRITAISGRIAIGRIRFEHQAEPVPYAECAEQYRRNGYTDTSGILVKVQGEKNSAASDASIIPVSDRMMAATEPNDPARIRLNAIGGEKWEIAGQWVRWQIDVPEEGLYEIGIKARQNVLNGAYSTRKLYVNDQVPFAEAENLQFGYSTDWKLFVPGGDDGPYKVYLHKGVNEIRLEATLGDIASLLEKVNGSLLTLNYIYREILMITGPVPDALRDYSFHKQIPEVLQLLGEEARKLEEVYKEYVRITGQSGQQAQTLKRIYQQAYQMSSSPNTIPESFNTFRNNISELASWLLLSKYQPLEIDYLFASSPDAGRPSPKTNLFSQLLFLIRQFGYSFIENYSELGGAGQGEESVEVWLNGLTNGRDQAQILLKLANERFTDAMNINLDLKLTPVMSLLPALMARQGPDVALTLGASEPVNYAIRNAVVDLTEFPDFSEISTRFTQSALRPFEFNGGVYALPETQTFFMLFYRKDILTELGLEIPQTWDEVIDMIPVLQKRNLSFGLPQVMGQNVGIGFYAYLMFLYQNGGSLYNDKGTASSLDTESAARAFIQWTKFYTDYGLPLQYDFINRFRSGELPIGIADYSQINILKVFAPDIKGLWGFTLVPGVRVENGSINRFVPGNTTGAIIVRATENPDSSWEFLKWWTRADTQSDFGLELETVLGPSGRYSPANGEALKRIPWSKKDYALIVEQRDDVIGVPEIPGSYMTPRLIDFAFRDVVNNRRDPDDTLQDTCDAINDEITNKRMEFGLSLD